MTSRLDTYQEFVLEFQSPWNLANETTHNWSQSFYVTGTVTHNDADAETAGLALAAPALGLAAAHTSLIKIIYYPQGSLVSTVNKVYAPGTHVGTGVSYQNSPTQLQQLEVAMVAHCPIGKNTRGKEIYLRKYFHDVASAPGNSNAHEVLTPAALALTPFNSGAGPHNVVPCSPRTGDSGTPWTFEPHLYTHQLRKGKKKKAAKGASLGDIVTQLVNAGLDAASALALARRLIP